MIDLSHEERYGAWDNWWFFWCNEKQSFTGYNDKDGGYDAFEKFVGANVFERGYLPADTVHKVKMLAGPHHFTILKALVARKEPENVQTST